MMDFFVAPEFVVIIVFAALLNWFEKL